MRRTRILAGLATAALLAVVGCGGGSDGGGEDTGGEQGDTTLTVWTTEDQADRVAKQQEIMNGWGSANGMTVKLVAVAEDQLTTVLQLGGCGRRHAGRDRRSVAERDQPAPYRRRCSTREAAKEIVDGLGAGHVPTQDAGADQRRRRADRRAERRVGAAALLPQGPLLRRRPGRAEDLRRRREGGQHAEQGQDGRHRGRDRAGRLVHRADLRADRTGQRLPAGRRRRERHAEHAGRARRRSASTAT